MLVTAHVAGGRQPFAVNLRQDSVHAESPSGWIARGLRNVPSGPVHFSGAASAQLDHAGTGASVVIGTVRVSDWDDRPERVRCRAGADYVLHGHDHIHGANLSSTALAYRRSGGFRWIGSDEDVALVHAFDRAGETLIWATDLAVTTSGRRLGRAPAGFAAYLDALEQATA